MPDAIRSSGGPSEPVTADDLTEAMCGALRGRAGGGSRTGMCGARGRIARVGRRGQVAGIALWPHGGLQGASGAGRAGGTRAADRGCSAQEAPARMASMPPSQRSMKNFSRWSDFLCESTCGPPNLTVETAFTVERYSSDAEAK